MCLIGLTSTSVFQLLRIILSFRLGLFRALRSFSF